MTSSNGRYSEYGGRSRHEEHILSRPSATSQEYEGHTSRSHVSIHNMIEQQSYEDRVGISSNSFDPERRGYTFSRDNNSYCDDNQRGRYERNNNPPSHHQRDRSNYGHGSNRYDQHQQQQHHNGGGNQHGGGESDYNRREYHEEARHPDHQHHRPNAGYQRDFLRNSDDNNNNNNNNRRSARDDDRRYDRSRPPNDRYYNDRGGGNNNNYNNQRDDRSYNNNNNNGGRHDRNNAYSHNQDRSQPTNYRSCSGGNRGETHSGQQSNEDDGGWETVPQRSDVRQRRAESRKNQNNHAQEQSAPQVAFVPPNDSNRNFTQFMLLLTGIPGSGKSTFAESLVTGKPWMYVRVNQDQLGSRRGCEDLTRRVLREGKCPIIDRCNFNPQQRQHFLNIAATANCPVDCIVFQVDMEFCIRRCQSRQNHETVSPQMARQVVSRMVRDFSPPLPNRINSETFRTLRMISNNDDSFNDVVMEYLNMIS